MFILYTNIFDTINVIVALVSVIDALALFLKKVSNIGNLLENKNDTVSRKNAKMT